MTQQDKELLLKDICARLPYGVIILDIASKHYGNFIRIDVSSLTCYYGGAEDEECQTIYNIKPYLRPMSSMTNEEFKEYHSMLIDIDKTGLMQQKLITKIVDWCDSKMFDHRSLLPKGLALEAPEGMYKI